MVDEPEEISWSAVCACGKITAGSLEKIHTQPVWPSSDCDELLRAELDWQRIDASLIGCISQGSYSQTFYIAVGRRASSWFLWR